MTSTHHRHLKRSTTTTSNPDIFIFASQTQIDHQNTSQLSNSSSRMARDHIEEVIHLIAVIDGHFCFTRGTFDRVEKFLRVRDRGLATVRVPTATAAPPSPLRRLLDTVPERLSAVNVAVEDEHSSVLVTVELVPAGGRKSQWVSGSLFRLREDNIMTR